MLIGTKNVQWNEKCVQGNKKCSNGGKVLPFVAHFGIELLRVAFYGRISSLYAVIDPNAFGFV